MLSGGCDTIVRVPLERRTLSESTSSGVSWYSFLQLPTASCDQGWDVEMYYTEESDVAGKVPCSNFIGF